jgi:ABC-type dipeptide/oligopeptide/nickel transport system permease subunit
MLIIFPWLTIFADKSAYLDPGSGSFLIQLAIAAIVGMAFVIRSQWSKIKKFFGGKTSKPEEEDEENEDNEQQ